MIHQLIHKPNYSTQQKQHTPKLLFINDLINIQNIMFVSLSCEYSKSWNNVTQVSPLLGIISTSVILLYVIPGLGRRILFWIQTVTSWIWGRPVQSLCPGSCFGLLCSFFSGCILCYCFMFPCQPSWRHFSFIWCEWISQMMYLSLHVAHKLSFPFYNTWINQH